MRHEIIPGGWYAAARPGGFYACQVRGGDVKTDGDTVPRSPGGDILQLDLAPNRVNFAGHGGSSNDAWEWTGSAWKNRGVAFGPNACLYTDDGTLNIVREGGTETGSLGWWYAKGSTLIPSWWVYNTSTPYAASLHAPTNLWAFTERDGILIGQGNGGVVAILNGNRHQIADGQTTFVKFHKTGNEIALAWIREDKNEAHLMWLTVEELAALPIVSEQPVPIDHGGEVLPTPVQPPPVEHKMEAQALPDDVYAIVTELHARNLPLANGTDDQRRELQQKICETTAARKGDRWGWKSNHGINQSNAKDAIAKLPDGATFTPNERQPLLIWDLFNGGTRAPNHPPVMSETENTEQYFVPVTPRDHLGVTQPSDEKPPVVTPPATSGGSTAPTADEKYDAVIAGLSVMAATLQQVTVALDVQQASISVLASKAAVEDIKAQLQRGFTNKYIGNITPNK